MKQFVYSLLLALIGVPLLAHGVVFLAVNLLLLKATFFTPWTFENEPLILYVPCGRDAGFGRFMGEIHAA